MASKNTITKRVHSKFNDEFFKYVKIERIKLGKDNLLKPINDARLTLAITRLPEFKLLRRKIILADLP